MSDSPVTNGIRELQSEVAALAVDVLTDLTDERNALKAERDRLAAENVFMRKQLRDVRDLQYPKFIAFHAAWAQEYKRQRDEAVAVADQQVAKLTALAGQLAAAREREQGLATLAKAYDDARQALGDHIETCERCDVNNMLCDVAVAVDVARRNARRELFRLALNLTDVETALKRAALAGADTLGGGVKE